MECLAAAEREPTFECLAASMRLQGCSCNIRGPLWHPALPLFYITGGKLPWLTFVACSALLGMVGLRFPYGAETAKTTSFVYTDGSELFFLFCERSSLRRVLLLLLR